MMCQKQCVSLIILILVTSTVIGMKGVPAEPVSAAYPPAVKWFKYDSPVLKPAGHPGDFAAPYSRNGYYYAIYTGYDRPRMMRSEG